MAPAMHVAVFNRLILKQRADFFQLDHDVGIGLPDKLTAKKRQVIHINTVALHRTDNVIIAHAVTFAGIEVILTIGWR